MWPPQPSKYVMKAENPHLHFSAEKQKILFLALKMHSEGQRVCTRLLWLSADLPDITREQFQGHVEVLACQEPQI